MWGWDRWAGRCRSVVAALQQHAEKRWKNDNNENNNNKLGHSFSMGRGMWRYRRMKNKINSMQRFMDSLYEATGSSRRTACRLVSTCFYESYCTDRIKVGKLCPKLMVTLRLVSCGIKFLTYFTHVTRATAVHKYGNIHPSKVLFLMLEKGYKSNTKQAVATTIVKNTAEKKKTLWVCRVLARRISWKKAFFSIRIPFW